MCGVKIKSYSLFPGVACLLLGCAFLLGAAPSARAEQNKSRSLRVFPNEYIIEPSLSALSLRADQIKPSYRQGGAEIVKELGRGIKLVRAAAESTALSAATLGKRSSILYDPSDAYCIGLIKSGLARSCSPNFEIELDRSADDPMNGSLWGLNAGQGIDAPAAWDVSTGSGDVVVAIIDTGVDYNHPDLRDNIWVNPWESARNGVDDDRDGYIDDVHGISTFGSGDPMDDNGHGTHVAGTIGAVGNNSLGVSGINWKVKIMAVKFLNAQGSGSLAGAIEGLNYVVMMKNKGVDVRLTNNSWGGGGFSQALYSAIQAARDAGVLCLAAAGNEANDNDANPSYPASYGLSNVVSVAAVGKDRNLASFSNFGAKSVDIAAPGVSILSTFPGGTYRTLSGTSMATPHVTGALALLLSTSPALSNQELLERLYASASPLSTLSGVVRTGRMLNAGRLINNQTNPLPTPTPLPAPCQYTVADIPYSPDYSADDAAVVQQADELNFQEIKLPFVFPFHRQQVSSIYLSPNGVIYTKSAPSSMDYQNRAVAPQNSIAALHSDLTANQDPLGVRVALLSDKATVYWRAKYYDRQSLSDVEVRVSLYSDGRVESFVALPDADLEQALSRHATIGLTGPTVNTASVYAYNSSQIHNGLGIRYTSSCSSVEPAASVSRIEAFGVDGSGRRIDRALVGAKVTVTLMGEGAGPIELFAAYNGQTCPGSALISMSQGAASSSSTMPKLPALYRTIEFKVSSGAKKSLKIRPSPRIRRSQGAARRKPAAARFTKSCESLLQSFTVN